MVGDISEDLTEVPVEMLEKIEGTCLSSFFFSLLFQLIHKHFLMTYKNLMACIAIDIKNIRLTY